MIGKILGYTQVQATARYAPFSRPIRSRRPPMRAQIHSAKLLADPLSQSLDCIRAAARLMSS